MPKFIPDMLSRRDHCRLKILWNTIQGSRERVRTTCSEREDSKTVHCLPSFRPSVNLSETQECAKLLHALADTTRLQMVLLLAEHSEKICVCHLTRRFSLDQSTISHYLRVLREAGLIAGVRQGICTYYFLHPHVLTPVTRLFVRLDADEALD